MARVQQVLAAQLSRLPCLVWSGDEAGDGGDSGDGGDGRDGGDIPRDGPALPVLLLRSSHIASLKLGTASRLEEDGRSPWPPPVELGTEGAGSDAAGSLSSSVA